MYHCTVCATIRSGLNLANMLIPPTSSIGPSPASQLAFPSVKQDWGRGDKSEAMKGLLNRTMMSMGLMSTVDYSPQCITVRKRTEFEHLCRVG